MSFILTAKGSPGLRGETGDQGEKGDEVIYLHSIQHIYNS